MALNKQPPSPSFPPSPQSNLEISIRKFIPKELIPDDWKCDNQIDLTNIDSLLKLAKEQLGMFESSDKLYKNVIQFMDFPGSDELFKMNRSHGKVVERLPFIPRSIKGRWCLYKNDLDKFFDHISVCPFRSELLECSQAILDDYWKSLRAGGHGKMIVCSSEPRRAETLESEDLNNILSRIANTFDSDVDKNFKFDYKTLRQQTEKTIASFIFDKMDLLSESINMGTLDSISVIAWVAYVFDKVIAWAREECIHLPPLNIMNSPKEQLPVVRLFSTGKDHFVMVHDFLEILQERGVKTSESDKWIPEKLRNEKLSTLSYDDALKALISINNKELIDLEFAKMRSALLMFNQTPIPTYYGGYCILAVDALYELLIDIIVAKKVFHCVVEEDWIVINEFFNSMQSHFDVNRDHIYFMDLNEVKAIKKEWNDCYEKNFLDRRPFISTVKFQTKTKLTEEKISNTLQDCKIKRSFEKMRSLDEIVPGVYKIFHKNNHLSRSHIYRAVTQCQINCLARKVPWILEFIEKQKSRNRMNIVDVAVSLERYDMGKAAEWKQMGTSEKKQGAKGNMSTKSNPKKNNKQK